MRRRTLFSACLSAVALALAGIGNTVLKAHEKKQGDLYVGSWVTLPGNINGILKVDRGTGEQTVVAQGGYLADLFDIIPEYPTTLLAVTPGFGNSGRVVRVDVGTGQQTVVATGLGQSTSAAFGPDGYLYVTDDGWGGPGGISKVDADFGTVTHFSTGGRPGRIIYHSNGYMYFTGSDVNGNPGIARLDLNTGIWTPLSSGGLFSQPRYIAEDLNGDLLVTDMGSPYDFNDSKIIRVKTSTGKQILLSDGEGSYNLNGIHVDKKGTIYVSDAGDGTTPAFAAVLKVNRGNGALTEIAVGDYMRGAGAITELASEGDDADCDFHQHHGRWFSLGKHHRDDHPRQQGKTHDKRGENT